MSNENALKYTAKKISDKYTDPFIRRQSKLTELRESGEITLEEFLKEHDKIWREKQGRIRKPHLKGELK